MSRTPFMTFAGFALSAPPAPARAVVSAASFGTDSVRGSGDGQSFGSTTVLATPVREPVAPVDRWQTPVALAVVALTVLALAWRVRANARSRRRGCGGDACAALSPEVERLRARLNAKPDR